MIACNSLWLINYYYIKLRQIWQWVLWMNSHPWKSYSGKSRGRLSEDPAIAYPRGCPKVPPHYEVAKRFDGFSFSYRSHRTPVEHRVPSHWWWIPWWRRYSHQCSNTQNLSGRISFSVNLDSDIGENRKWAHFLRTCTALVQCAHFWQKKHQKWAQILPDNLCVTRKQHIRRIFTRRFLNFQFCHPGLKMGAKRIPPPEAYFR